MPFGSEADRGDKNSEWISKAREKVYRYAIYAYDHTDMDGTLGQATNTPGHGFVMTSGASKRYGTERMQADTFLHELGHTLGLSHGGMDDENCKPNYLSTMNYIYDALAYPRTIDYSRHATPMLNESALDEKKGFAGPKEWKVLRFGVTDSDGIATEVQINAAAENVDWDGSGMFDEGPISAAISRVGDCDDDDDQTYLFAQNDWDNLRYNFRTETGDRFKKSGTPPDEQTEEEKLASADKVDSDKDGVSNRYDVCILLANPDQADTDGDDVGDACDACPNEQHHFMKTHVQTVLLRTVQIITPGPTERMEATGVETMVTEILETEIMTVRTMVTRQIWSTPRAAVVQQHLTHPHPYSFSFSLR